MREFFFLVSWGEYRPFCALMSMCSFSSTQSQILSATLVSTSMFPHQARIQWVLHLHKSGRLRLETRDSQILALRIRVYPVVFFFDSSVSRRMYLQHPLSVLLYLFHSIEEPIFRIQGSIRLLSTTKTNWQELWRRIVPEAVEVTSYEITEPLKVLSRRLKKK